MKSGIRDVECFAPDWARLAFHVLESMIRFGATEAHEYMRDAVEAYYALADKYPNEVPADFAEWMSDQDGGE